MILRDLRKLNQNYLTDYESISSFTGSREAETDGREIQNFKHRWISSTATLTDWIKMGPVNLDAIVISANLEDAAVQKIKERQIELFNQWLEMYLDRHYLRKFKEVYDITPAFAPKYAEIQLQLIERLLQGDDIAKNAYEPRMLRHERNVDYPRLYSLYTDGAVHPFDIYSPSKDVWLHVLLAYKEFLEQFIKDPVIEEAKVEYDPYDFSLAALYPNTIAMLSKLTVEYSFTDRCFKEETYRTYKIREVNSHYSVDSYRSALKKCYKEEYKAMLHKLRAVDKSKWADYLEAMVGELHELRQKIITTDEYKQEEGEYSEEKINTYNRVKQMAFIGKADEHLAFDQSESSTYRYLVKLAEPFADVVSETIGALIGKLEDTDNYLELLDFAMEVAAENSNPAISFDYKQKNKKYENITSFYKALKDAGLIENTTTLTVFRNAFTGGRVNRKICWTGTVGQLQYIIKQIHNVKRKVEPLSKRLWETACHCFERSGGVQFDPGQLRQAKTPAITKELDQILNNL